MSISDAELDSIRAEQEKFFPSLVTIKRQAFIGGDETATDVVATDVPARITSGFGVFRQVADRFQNIAANQITVAWDQDIKIDDLIIDEASARVFKAVELRDGSSIQTAKQILGDCIR